MNAVLAIEDRRFFQHSGVNYFRLAEAAMVDVREGRHGQGGSTITMQLSRGFFLTPEKTMKRKMTRDADRHRAGAEVLQAAHIPDVRQPGLSGPARHRSPSMASAKLHTPTSTRT